ncbi:MAG: UvrB/UvrC motif-containing protein [Elusimicrobia bacterium]|nr:UvrB/UvrC motif-containing protein [Elusimicrobiota bacterium]
MCQACQQQEATLHFKGVINDQVVKLHLCEGCAKEKGVEFPFGKSPLSLAEWISGLGERAAQEAPTPVRAACTACGTTITEMKESGRVGCSTCYVEFSKALEPFLKRIHGATRHTGRTYRVTVERGSSLQAIGTLKAELAEALQKEDYEKAAIIRDQIKMRERNHR